MGSQPLRGQNLGTAVDLLDGIVCEFDPPTRRLLSIRGRVERILGYKPAVVAKDPEFWVKHVHKDDRESFVRFCQEAESKSDQEIEYMMIHADGHDVWMHGRAGLSVDGDGKPILIAVMIDITHQKHAELQMKKLYQLFETFMNNCPVLACLKDSEGKIVYANDTFCQTFGKPPEDIIGHTDFYFMPAEYAGKVRANDDTVRELRKEGEFEENMPVADGSVRLFRSHKFPYVSAERELLVGSIGIDVTPPPKHDWEEMEIL